MHVRLLHPTLRASGSPQRTGSAAGARPRTVPIAPWRLVGVLIACLVIAACTPGQAMLEVLPTRAADVTFSQARVIDDDDGFLIGYAVDEVYAGLGRSRDDGASAERLDPASGDLIGAMRVNEVDGEELLDAFVQHWQSASVVERVAGTIGHRSVWTLRHHGGGTTVAYRRDDVVFYAYGEQAGRAAEYVNDLP